MEPKTLDHVAFWLADREPVAEFVTTKLGLHVIDRQDNFTLVGADARRGKLTLFDAEGPREAGAFKHVALRVSKLPEGETEFELGEASTWSWSRRRQIPSTTSTTSRCTPRIPRRRRRPTRGTASMPLHRRWPGIRASKSAVRTSSSIPATPATRRSPC